jgi:hypothetical protein
MARGPFRGRGDAVGVAPAASPPLQPGADRGLIRLELVRLAHRHDHTSEEIVKRAQALEAYVLGDQAADKF